MTTFVLGSGGPRRDALRDGALAFESRRGIPEVLRALVEALPTRAPRRCLTGHDSEGVLALCAAALWPESEIHQHHLDAYVGRRAAAAVAQQDAVDVTGHVSADLPPGPFDLVALPFPGRGEALLSREWLTQAHDRLAPGGRLLAATDVRPDWLRKVVKEVFGRADLVPRDGGGGSVVTARRTKETTRWRDHGHVLQVRWGPHELALRSRPGTFSPGRLDAGTRALLDRFHVEPGERVLDLGCGIGVLGLAAAATAGAEGCVLVDSNARAVELARENAERNGLEAATVVLRADLEDLPGAPFDCVVANPPYFSNDRIAESFCRTAARLLRPSGRLWLVAKAQDRHRAVLEREFAEVRVETVRGYGVFEARVPRGDSAPAE